MEKKILYIDMDGVLVDFDSAVESLPQDVKEANKGKYDEYDGLFAMMKPYENALEAFRFLSTKFDTYILSTAPWRNPSSWIDKLLWVQKYFGVAEEGNPAYKRLIITHNKNLNMGDYLIDDRVKNGAGEFKGEHIHYDTEKFPDWETVIRYLAKKENFSLQGCNFIS